MRYRTLVRNLVIGWLAAEWVGVLIAYSFALVVLTFFIGLILLDLIPGGTFLLPMILAACVTGLLFAWWALAIPRELIFLIGRPSRVRFVATRAPSLALEPAPVVSGAWQVNSFLSRMSSVDRAGSTATSGARPFSISASLDRLIPLDPARNFGAVASPSAIPPLGRIAVTTRGPIRIVDLSEGPRPRLDEEFLRNAMVRGTLDNPGRIRQA